MRRPGRLKRTARGAAVVVGVTLAAAAVASARWCPICPLGRGYVVAGGGGAVQVHWLDPAVFPTPLTGWRLTSWGGPAIWWTDWRGESKYWRLGVPLWMPAAALLLPAAGSWWAERRARHRDRVFTCRRCGYDRAGVPASSPCPECGTGAR